MSAVLRRMALRAFLRGHPGRGADEGQARQRPDAVVRPEGDERAARRVARGEPDRGQQVVKKALSGGPGRGSRPRTPATRSGARRRCRVPACPTSSRTARAATPARASCSSSRATRRAAPRVDARDPRTQAILPIRGKILNVERARVDKMLKNNEIQALITAIGAGVGEEFDAAKARYHKVIVLADADVDGSHIRTLLLTFFFRQMRAAGRGRLRLHRPAAAVLDRGRQGEDVPQGRRGQGARSSPSARTTRRSSRA